MRKKKQKGGETPIKCFNTRKQAERARAVEGSQRYFAFTGEIYFYASGAVVLVAAAAAAVALRQRRPA